MEPALGTGARSSALTLRADSHGTGPARGEAFDLLALFSLMWGAAALFHLFRPATILAILRFDVEGAAHLAMCLFAIALVLRPRCIDLLFFLGAAQIVEYVVSMPVGSNHYTITFYLNLAICFSYLLRRFRGRAVARGRGAFFASWAPVGRHLIVLTYFFGVFHKLNTDWFDPSVSCAVALTDSLVVPLGLKFPGLDQLVIYGTLVVEGGAMILLCVPRWKYLGFLIGMPLHMIIGLVPYSWYPNFSALTFALYALFLPEDLPARLELLLEERPALMRLFRRLSADLPTTLLLSAGGIVMGSLLVYAFLDPFAAGEDFDAEKAIMHGALMAIWGAYSTAFYAFFLLLLRGRSFAVSRGYWRPRPRVAWVLPLLFLLNGFAPYLGLKTDGAISMFSNLHTEASVTNHLLLNPPPYLFDYQERVVEIVASSSERLQELADRELRLVEFSLWSHVQQNPDISLTYRVGDEIRHLERAGDALVGRELPLLLRKLMPFKEVDLRQPRTCTH